MQIFNKKRGQKGFTLIELLVVIAIIGILAGIVLVALGGARDRAKDARIQSDMAQLRTVGELFYGNQATPTYTGLAADVSEGTLNTDITNQGGTYAIWVNTNGNAFCATSSLNGGGFWCVDSGLKSEKDANGTLVNCVTGCVIANTCRCD